MNKRMKVLLGILCVALLVAVGQQVMEKTNVGGGGGKKLEQVKNVNRDHLRISSLYPLNYTLKSVGSDPFFNPLDKKAQQQQTQTLQTTQPPKHNEDVIPITPPVMQRNPDDKKQDNKIPMKLKAIAHSGDRSVAVIENGGKTVSVFVGGAVGNYIVTNISDSQVFLQNFAGQSLVLDVSN